MIQGFRQLTQSKRVDVIWGNRFPNISVHKCEFPPFHEKEGDSLILIIFHHQLLSFLISINRPEQEKESAVEVKAG